MSDKFIYEIDGQKGQILKLYEDRCIVSYKSSLKTLFSKNKPASEKVYFFKYITDIRMSSKTSAGVIAFEYKDPEQNAIYESGNTFEYGAGFTTPMYGVVTGQMDHVYKDLVKYWKAAGPETLVSDSSISASQPETPISAASVADELLKFKQLLDMGAITQEEFEEQKEKLLHS